ncbi:hypothetical protein ACLOJK_013876 [Asimina triloba]
MNSVSIRLADGRREYTCKLQDPQQLQTEFPFIYMVDDLCRLPLSPLTNADRFTRRLCWQLQQRLILGFLGFGSCTASFGNHQGMDYHRFHVLSVPAHSNAPQKRARGFFKCNLQAGRLAGWPTRVGSITGHTKHLYTVSFINRQFAFDLGYRADLRLSFFHGTEIAFRSIACIPKSKAADEVVMGLAN